MRFRIVPAALAVLVFATSAAGQVRIGLMVSATGPTSAIGIPQKNTGDILPKKIGGVDVEYISLEDGGDTTLENLNRGPGHCDIVVEVRSGEVHAIGGNVGDSVTRSVFPLDGSGFLTPISARRFFTVVENRLP